MDSMIERVAQRIGTELAERGVIINFADEIAKAAIEAMREPTGAMNDAAAVELPELVRTGANYLVEIDDDAGAQVWYVMIREALKEPT